MRTPLLAIFFALIGLTGCSTVRLVDTEVNSFAATPAMAPGALYRFERLPSQQARTAQQDALEAIAQEALEKVGLQRNDAAASYAVQVSASLRVDYRSSYPFGPGYGLGWGLGGYGMFGHRTFIHGWGMSDSPYYWREVSLIIRELGSTRVVYETHASHDGPWSDSEALLPALFEAALQDFPTPPPGPRRIDIEIPR